MHLCISVPVCPLFTTSVLFLAIPVVLVPFLLFLFTHTTISITMLVLMLIAIDLFGFPLLLLLTLDTDDCAFARIGAGFTDLALGFFPCFVVVVGVGGGGICDLVPICGRGLISY